MDVFKTFEDSFFSVFGLISSFKDNKFACTFFLLLRQLFFQFFLRMACRNEFFGFLKEWGVCSQLVFVAKRAKG